ncbi:MAG: GAF domain-containing protein [Chloroflexi bacterium]|nr:GAF domain-containing protein [Chloroflexota bacterium]
MPSERPLSTSDQEHLRLLKALRESELLRELSELLASSLDPTRILQVLVRRATEVCDVERCAIWLLDESRALFLPSAYHLSTPYLKRQDAHAVDNIWHHSSLPFNNPVIHRMLQQNGTLPLADLRTEPSMRIIAEKFLVHSVLLVAFLREGRIVGMMSLDDPGKTRSFSKEQQQLARAIGQQAAVAIDNARLYQQAQAERRRAERLIGRAQSIYQVAMAVNSGEDLSHILQIATQHLVDGLDANGAAIALLAGDTLSVVSTTGLYPPSPSDIPIVPTLSELPHCCTATLQGVPLFVTTTQAEGIERDWYQQLGLENVMIVPLLVGTRKRNGRSDIEVQAPDDTIHTVGFVFVNYQQPGHRPSHGQYAFAQDIAAQCALAIEKANLLAKAHQAAALATERAITLDAVFNAMTEGIAVLDLEGEFIISNKAISHFLGLPLLTKQQLPMFLKRHPAYTLQGQPIPYEDFPLVRALHGELVRNERFMSKRIDGSDRSLEVNVVPLFDSEARKIGFVSAFRDITEQVRVERRIRQALDTMLHAAEVVSGITDIREILHRILTMTLNALNSERGVVQLYDQEQQVFTPLLSIGFTAEEETQWLEEQKCWLSPTEDQYAGFYEQLLEGHATLVNAEQYLEQPNPFQYTMVLAAPITHNNRLLGVMMLDRSATLKKEAARAQQPGITRPLPRQEFSIWDMAIIEGIAQLAGLAIEQTHWQKEAEIARSNEATMRESNALKDEFLAITAHEFRTPLTVVLAHSQMMARVLRKTAEVNPQLREKLNESISIIELQTHQLTNIVNTFLEVTRLNRGQISLALEEINLAEVAKQAVHTHSTTSSIHQISYHIEPCDKPYLVMGDKARLLQIFANLLQNAIKYSSFGGPVTVRLTQCTNEEGHRIIEACVADKGIGVPKEAQPYLFERFYRAHNVESSKARGVGLGLYVVAEFLRLHGGTIRVESSGVEGEGSRFIFTLPLLEK